MKIYYSPASPFVRKCLVVAHELGIADRIEHLPSAAHPVNRDSQIIERNPLGQVPTFFCDDGQVLYDSRVICEYLNASQSGDLFPAMDDGLRWQRLTELSLADGITAATLLARYETAVRPEALRWNDWTQGQFGKVRSGIEWLDRAAPGFGDSVHIGSIAFACALGYLDFRFPDHAWRADAPAAAKWFDAFSQRPSMVATRPPA